MHLASFTYDLPDDRIAQHPVEPRDASRLLDASSLTDHRFRDLPELLEPGDLLVVNESKVRHARLLGHKGGSGGRVEALLLGFGADGTWEALVRPARRIRAGTTLRFDGLTGVVDTDPVDGAVRLRLEPDDPAAGVEAAIERGGTVPLPPYIRAALDRPERYQTIYAARTGSAAAPTAGLHFTPNVFDRLDERGVEVAAVELEIGLATFRPIVTEQIEDHEMHTERYTVPSETAAAVAAARRRGGAVVAVGTTVVRTLESAADGSGGVRPGSDATALYLRPGSDLSVVDRLVTNFHMPGSSLLVLLAAFMGDGWRTAYEAALARGYRFLSFGDAMICDRA